MAVMTLEEMKKGMPDKVYGQIIDTFLRYSDLLQMLPFDDCVSAAGVGSTLEYTYYRKKLPATAEFRKLYGEYTASQATKEKASAILAILGGEVQIDRVLNRAAGKWDNLAYQIEEHIAAVVNLFHYTVINGDHVTTAATDHPQFEGLDSMVAGTSTEYNTDKVLDLSTMENIKNNADEFYEMLTVLLNTTKADALLTNAKMLAKIQTVARILGYKTESEQAFGRTVTTIDGKRIMDLGTYVDVNEGEARERVIVNDAIARTVGTAKTGLTDLYAVKFDVADGFHGISLNGEKAVKAALPNFNEPGTVKKADVEMVAATALKNTRHAGVIRNVKIA